jgi:alanine racemase
MATIFLKKNAFLNNITYYSKLLGDKNKLCIALKDNAYGHGIEPIAKLCNQFGINHAIVKDTNEANIANKYNFETILVLYSIPTKTYSSNISFAINNINHIKNYPSNTSIELKIDTGMSRNGIQISQIDEAINLIKKYNLNLKGVFTHFCCADEQNDTTSKQEKIFDESIKKIKQLIDTPFRTHCANSAASHKIDNSKYDIARIGIGLYGYIDIEKYSKNLKPVLSLYANKISTRILNINDSIGYGATYKVTQNNFKVSNYDIGYGDGFFRLNERKKAKIKDQREILGRVSMDSLSVQGDDDEICIFDDATYLAKIHDTIHYEILTHLSSTIKRVII